MITADTPPAAPSFGDFLTTEEERARLAEQKRKLKRLYPNLDESKKPLLLGKQERNRGQLVVPGKGKGTELRVFNADGSVNQTFAKTNSDWLGPTAQTLLEDRDNGL